MPYQLGQKDYSAGCASDNMQFHALTCSTAFVKLVQLAQFYKRRFYQEEIRLMKIWVCSDFNISFELFYTN